MMDQNGNSSSFKARDKVRFCGPYRVKNPSFFSFHDFLSEVERALSPQRRDSDPDRMNVYVNTPFCRSRCSFCMYTSTALQDRRPLERHIASILAQMEKLRTAFGPIRTDCAYFGGGTPSIMSETELKTVLEHFSSTFQVRSEFTFEANPSSINPEKMTILIQNGVNRVSLGIQSTDPQVLARICRDNGPRGNLEKTIRMAVDRGVEVNTDLVLGLPGQSLESVRQDIRRVAALGPSHLTVYRFQPSGKDQLPEGCLMYSDVFTHEFLDEIAYLGFSPSNPDSDNFSFYFGLQNLSIPRELEAQRYSFWDDIHANRIALGTGAYSHFFGRAVWTDVSDPLRTPVGEPVYTGFAVTAWDECNALLEAFLSAERFIPAQTVTLLAKLDPERDWDELLRDACRAGLLEATDLGYQSARPFDSKAAEWFQTRLAPPDRTDEHDSPFLCYDLTPYLHGDPRFIEKMLPTMEKTPLLWCRMMRICKQGDRLLDGVVKHFNPFRNAITFHLPKSGEDVTLYVRLPDATKYFMKTRMFAFSLVDSTPEGRENFAARFAREVCNLTSQVEGRLAARRETLTK